MMTLSLDAGYRVAGDTDTAAWAMQQSAVRHETVGHETSSSSQ